VLPHRARQRAQKTEKPWTLGPRLSGSGRKGAESRVRRRDSLSRGGQSAGSYAVRTGNCEVESSSCSVPLLSKDCVGHRICANDGSKSGRVDRSTGGIIEHSKPFAQQPTKKRRRSSADSAMGRIRWARPLRRETPPHSRRQASAASRNSSSRMEVQVSHSRESHSSPLRSSPA